VRRREATWGNLGAAIHRHSLNIVLKKEEKKNKALDEEGNKQERWLYICV